jgi:hypothetical protein
VYTFLADSSPPTSAGDKPVAASLNQALSHVKRGSMAALTLTLLAAAADTGCLRAGKPDKDVLLGRLNAQLREEKFEQLYEGADGGLRYEWAKETFVRRMKVVVAKLKEIDPDLNLQRDSEAERDHGLETDPPYSMMACQRLEKGDKSVLVLHSWNEKGEFHDLSVIPLSEASKKYRIHGFNVSIGKETE